MSWNGSFSSMEGGSDFERQSWRDSSNGGRAAGDITGNVNAQLNREREAFQGATWSGSSSQRSALQLARAMGVGQPRAADGGAAGAGPGSGAVGVAVSSGPGVSRVVDVTATKKGSSLQIGTGPGNPFSGPAPLTPGKKDKATGGFAGVEIHPNPWFSNVEDFWEPRYGEPGEWLGGLVNIGSDLVFNIPGVMRNAGLTPKTPYLGAQWTPNLDYHEMPGLPPVERRAPR